MAKRITKITKSDGSVEYIETQKKGFGHYFLVFLAIIFVIAEASKSPWLSIVIVCLAVLAVFAKIDAAAKKKKA
jgi:uncharacterized membrane protein